MTHHVAFTIIENIGYIIIKNDQHVVELDEHVLLGNITGELAEWLVCKAALRLAGKLRGELHLYSDCAVLLQLAELDPGARTTARVLERNGRPPGIDGLLGQYYDALGLLWELCRGRWTATPVSQERVLAAVKRGSNA